MENVKKNSVTKLLGTIAIGGTLAASLMACSPSTFSNSSSASMSVETTKTYTFGAWNGSDRKRTAEQMALLAESLVRPNTIVQAHQIAFHALERDQFNTRAQFVLKATQPIMELKGIYKRMLPIVSSRPEKLREYKAHLVELQSQQTAPDTFAFLMDGQPDLRTEGQVQDVVEKVVEKIDELRDWLKENRKVAHTINMYEDLGGQPVCKAERVDTNTWKTTNCDRNVRKKTAKMNIADFETIRQMVSGTQVYIAMTTAYSVDGIFKKGGVLPDSDATGKDKVQAFSAIKGLGQLRNTKFFSMLPKVTADLVTGLKIAKKMHAQLCPKGQPHAGSRKGMLFDSGICTDQSAKGDRLIAVLDAMARGQLTATDVFQAQGVEATVDLKAIVQAPPKDLRNLGPFAYDACDNIVKVGDGSVAGLFVNGELNQVLRQESVLGCSNQNKSR